MKIQQKRNKTIHTDLAKAKKYLQDYVTTNKTKIKDGEVLYTRYYAGGDIDNLRVYTLRGFVDATTPTLPIVAFDNVNNDNIVRENLLYYSYTLLNKNGYFKSFKTFDANITNGAKIRSDRAFTFSFELLPQYYSSTYDNNKVYFELKNKTTDQVIPIKLVDKGYSYITQDMSRILFTIKQRECKSKERLSVTFTIDDMKSHASDGDVVLFRMYVESDGSSIEYMRNPKLELGFQMTDYCENKSMKQNYLYDKSIKYTKDVTTTLSNNIKALHTPKYNYNNIEVSLLNTYIKGKYEDVFSYYYTDVNVVSGTTLNEKKTIENISTIDNKTLTTSSCRYFVVPALKVKGYNEDKLYLNGYGVDIIYYKYDNTSKKNNITAIKTNKKKQCVLTKYDESGGYSYYRIIDSNISDSSGSTPLACIPVDILFNTNTTPRPFMVDSSGKMMYPKIDVQNTYYVDQLYFTSGTSTITPPDVDLETPTVNPPDWYEIPKDDPSTPWKEGFN